MTHSPSKRARLQLRSRNRDDAWLSKLLSEVRAHEKQNREELRKADAKNEDLRCEIEKERAYCLRVKKERDGGRAKFEDAVEDADRARRDLAEVKASMGNSDAAYKRQIADPRRA